MESFAAVDAGASGILIYAAAYAAMLVIPGPSFMIVSQASFSASRREAALVAIGVASGAGLLTMFLLRGAANLPLSEAWAEIGHLAGTLLLLLVGFRAVRRALLPEGVKAPGSRRGGTGSYFMVGLLTALTNPISFAYFSSVALAVRSGGGAGVDGALMSAGVFLMALCWFGSLAMLLSLPPMRNLYLRAARRLDGLTGVILIVIALSWLVRGM